MWLWVMLTLSTRQAKYLRGTVVGEIYPVRYASGSFLPRFQIYGGLGVFFPRIPESALFDGYLMGGMISTRIRGFLFDEID